MKSKRELVLQQMVDEPYPAPDPEKRHRYEVTVILETEPIQPSLLSYVRDTLEGKLRPTGAPCPVRVVSLSGVYGGEAEGEPDDG